MARAPTSGGACVPDSFRLPLVTLGLLFYLNPALQMAWGVLVGHEPMPVGRWIGFALIWLALVVLTVGALRRRLG